MVQVQDIRKVQDDGRLTVWLHRGTSKRLIVSFWDSEEGGEPIPAFAHAATAGGRDNVLFFADPAKTWLNAPGLIEEITEWCVAFRQECGAEVVDCLGQGMGGFMAIAMAAILEVKVVLALSPLYSVPMKDMAPGTSLHDLRLHNLGEVLGPGVHYYLIHGEGPGEIAHCESFPTMGNLHQYILPDGGRGVPLLLDETGKTAEVLERAFLNQPRRLRMALTDMGVYRRADQREDAD